MSFEGKFEEKNAAGDGDVAQATAATAFEGKNAEEEEVVDAGAAAATSQNSSMQAEGFWLKDFLKKSGLELPEEHRLVIVRFEVVGWVGLGELRLLKERSARFTLASQTRSHTRAPPPPPPLVSRSLIHPLRQERCVKYWNENRSEWFNNFAVENYRAFKDEGGTVSEVEHDLRWQELFKRFQGEFERVLEDDVLEELDISKCVFVLER